MCVCVCERQGGGGGGGLGGQRVSFPLFTFLYLHARY